MNFSIPFLPSSWRVTFTMWVATWKKQNKKWGVWMGKILYRWGFPIAMFDSRRNKYIWNYLDIFTYLNPSPNVKMWARWSRCRISLFIGCNDFQIVLFTGFVWTQELIIISTCKYWIDCRVCPNIGYQGTPNSRVVYNHDFPYQNSRLDPLGGTVCTIFSLSIARLRFSLTYHAIPWDLPFHFTYFNYLQ